MSEEARILIVDDELPVCRSIEYALEEEACEVETALSGEEALKKDGENPHDIIVADLMMPGISGMDLLRTIREKRSDAIFIMITGYPSISTAVQSVKMGAFDYIPKPFTPDELLATISRALERKRLLEEELAGAETGQPEISIPDGTHIIPGNSWVREKEDGNVRVGVHHMLLRTIRTIGSFEFPGVGEKRGQGESCLWIIDEQEKIHRLWCPVSGRIIEVNTRLEEDVSKLTNDPYQSGWVLLMSPTDLKKDLENLKRWGGF